MKSSSVTSITDFRNLFERERTLISAIRFQGLRADLDYLKELENSQTQPRLRSKRIYWYSVAAAACVGILALILVLPSRDTTGKLFDSYFKPYPNVFEPTLRGSEVEIARAQAFQAYEQGDYERASVLFKQLLNEREEAGILLLLGSANLMLNKTAEARSNFNALLEHYDNLDIEARWYLGLVSLKDGNKEKAISYLKKVASSESVYAPKAREILGKMGVGDKEIGR